MSSETMTLEEAIRKTLDIQIEEEERRIQVHKERIRELRKLKRLTVKK